MLKNCKNCGAQMPEEAHLCLSCLTETDEKTVITENNKPLFFANKKRAAALIATAVLIVISIVICILCFSNKNNMSAIPTSDTETNKTVVSTVTEEDGSVITEYDDGSIATKEPDGTIVTKEKDGTVITKQTDGTVKTKKADGTVETKKPDGTTVTEEPDGTVKTETPDGTTVTEKPDGTIITEKPDGTTETTVKPTEKPSEPSTSKVTSSEKPTTPSSTKPTTNTTTSTTENNNQAINYNDFTFEYRTYGKKQHLCITKYTGNSKTVTVPYSYNGENIYEISEKTFLNNSTVEKIIFNASEDYAPGIHTFAIYKCPNIKEVVFNWSSYKKEIYYNSQYGTQTIGNCFAAFCENLTNIKITGSIYYKVYENGLYYNRSYNASIPNQWRLICSWGNEWTQPEWCEVVASYIFNNTPQMKTIYINPQDNTFLHYQSQYLEHIYILEGNQYYYNDENGNVVKISNNKIQPISPY